MRYFMLIFLICLSSLTFGQQKDKSVVGKWIGTDEKNQTGGIQFLIDGTAKLLMMGQEMPISEYKVDYSKDPIWIDLIVKNNGQTKTLFGLISFVDSTTIKWEVFPMANNNRPIKFSDKTTNTAVILKKQ
ncbi:MAG: hypothetical protein IPO21_02670 [Bacteroidales bacterium]|nr:hypothetical protein [Bacteroidales bacterium]